MLPGVFSGASREVRVRRVISAQWLDCAVDTRRDVSLTQVAVRARSCVLRVHHQIVGPRLIDYGRPTSAIGRTRHFGLSWRTLLDEDDDVNRSTEKLVVRTIYSKSLRLT